MKKEAIGQAMAKLSLFGISQKKKTQWIKEKQKKERMRKVEQQFHDFMTCPFPGSSEDDNIRQLHTELIALDSHVAGLVSTYLKKGSIRLEWLDYSDEYAILLQKCSEGLKQKYDILHELCDNQKEVDKLLCNYQELMEIIRYKEQLDQLINQVKAIEMLPEY